MNRVFTSIILALSLFSTAAAQTSSSASQPQDPNEIIVLSSYTDGNYNVERLLVMESTTNNNEFAVRYKINLTKLISSYDNNSSEIAGLHDFIDSIKGDSLKQITRYDIVGYSSPDGPAATNKRLADERATDFNKFVNQKCDLSEYPNSVTGTPYKWIDTKEAIESSSVPSKSQVIATISGNMPQSAIEAELKSNSAAWDYIKDNILPPMRCVEIHIKYNSWKVVERRTLIEEVVEVPVVEGAVVDLRERGGRDRERGDKERGKIKSEDCEDYFDCILIEMPDQAIDFDDECTPEGKEREKFKENRRRAKYKERGKGGRGKMKERTKRNRWWRRK